MLLLDLLRNLLRNMVHAFYHSVYFYLMKCDPEVIGLLGRACRLYDTSDELFLALTSILVLYWEDIKRETRVKVTTPMRFGKMERLFLIVALSECEVMESGYLKYLTDVMIHIGYEVYKTRPNRIRNLREYNIRQSKTAIRRIIRPHRSRVVNINSMSPVNDNCSPQPIPGERPDADSAFAPTSDIDITGFQIPYSDSSAFASFPISDVPFASSSAPDDPLLPNLEIDHLFSSRNDNETNELPLDCYDVLVV